MTPSIAYQKLIIELPSHYSMSIKIITSSILFQEIRRPFIILLNEEIHSNFEINNQYQFER